MTVVPEAAVTVVPEAAVTVVPEAAVMGTAVDGISSSSSAQLTLAEQVEFLKRELGLSGNMANVVHQAAEQLGIDPAGKPLLEVAAMCMQVAGD